MLIKNAFVVTEADCAKRDVRIEGELIAEIGGKLPANGDEVIDAEGQYLLPGGVDVHTHFELSLSICNSAADFYHGTAAAACGGTTTIIEHPGFGPKDCKLMHQIDAYKKLAGGKAVIDYGFHGVAQHLNADVLNDLPLL
ncbi:MAG: amidohydrolase family protein, partial [Defluviitaleaceae bacterium]|nr:amidohydrolase family protein [Defluviitaleaceae bacterium]